MQETAAVTQSRYRREYACLAVIVAAGLALRLWAIRDAVAGGVISDPDGYIAFARKLGDGAHAWAWTFDAVTYGEFFRAPLYPLLLSAMTAQGLGIVGWGLTIHAILNASSIVSMWAIGRSLHTSRAGLISAAAYALWIPNIRLTTGFWQEHLYVPLLLLSLALLGQAIERRSPRWLWLSAGAAFGAASLTRSAALYFLPVVALWVWWNMPERKHRVGVVLFLAAVLTVTVPYVAALSTATGRFIPIEDVGSYGLKAYYSVSPSDPSITLNRYARNQNIAPSGVQVARFLAADFMAGPFVFTAARANMARLLWKPAGASGIEGAIQPDQRSASRHKLWTHLSIDVPFILALTLLPIGFAVSRNGSLAGLLVLWILQSTLLQALVMWAGLRYRAPIEPAVIALASAAMAGGWTRPRRATLIAAAGLFALVAASLAANADGLIRARAAYGLDAWPPAPGATSTFTGGAGLRSPVVKGEIRLSVQALESDAMLTVRLDGRVIDTIRLSPGLPQLLAYHEVGQSSGYLEFEARTADGRPAQVSVAAR